VSDCQDIFWVGLFLEYELEMEGCHAITDIVKCASDLAIIALPLVLIEHSGHSNSGSLMQIG